MKSLKNLFGEKTEDKASESVMVVTAALLFGVPVGMINPALGVIVFGAGLAAFSGSHPEHGLKPAPADLPRRGK